MTMFAKQKSLRTFFPEQAQAVAGWGRKRSATRARIFGKLSGRKAVFLEDGFLRSFGREDAPISLVCDDLGIYYDARSPSRLERLIGTPISDAEAARALQLAGQWRDSGVSKYNQMPDWQERLDRPFVLLFDQVAGDKSIVCGLADHASFSRMLEDAKRDFPDALIVVKTHPDVVTKKKQGHFDVAALQEDPRVHLIGDAVHPVRMIAAAEAVYTVSSQTGFEALLHGKPVVTYGVPFYAGWGLTEDRADRSNALVAEAFDRRKATTFAQVVHAALIAYPAYVDPFGNRPITPETAIDIIAKKRARIAKRPKQIHALGFSPWKRPIVRRFLAPSDVTFCERDAEASEATSVAVWGARSVAGLPSGARVFRVEDGFIRSKGLGAALTMPVSWIVDDVGIYFDSSGPSRLEELLSTSDISDAEQNEAKTLREGILAAGITKYNIDGAKWCRPAGEERVILVPGQVESDASIQFGSPQIKTNFDLVSAVRQANPDAFVVYKPHPDVENGFRAKGPNEVRIPEVCDEVVAQGSINEIFTEVDEVHTLTSLSGFEALMRGLKVVCYGQPFYSGWGLTTDIHPCSRRGRARNLDELVFAALIAYPSYVGIRSGRTISAQEAIVEIAEYSPRLWERLPMRKYATRFLARWSERKRMKGRLT